MRNLQPWQALLAGFWLALLALLVAPAAAFAGTFVVTKTEDTADGVCNSDCSLREAIIATNANFVPDTIRLGPGVYLLDRYGAEEDAGDTGDLDILEDLTLTGGGAETTIIDGMGADRVLDIRSPEVRFDVRVSGITIRNGRVDSLTYCGTTFGGGIRSVNASLALGSVILTGNRAGANAGALAGCSGVGGGGLYFEQSGGTQPAELVIVDSQVIANTAAGSGGGIYAWQYFGSPAALVVSLTHSSVLSNTAGAGEVGPAFGGGVYFSGDSQTQPATLTLERSTVAGNRAFGTQGLGGSGFATGGGIHFMGFYAPKQLSIVDSSITDNSALGNDEGVASNGGGVFFDSVSGSALGDLTIENSILARNVSGSGGGLHALIQTGRSASIVSSSIFDNQAIATSNYWSGLGGGIYASHGLLMVTNSTVSGNTARNGGGVTGSSGGSLALVNATVSANTASESGGGLFHMAVQEATLANTVLADNAGGTCGDDGYSATLTSLGHNLSSDATCALAAPGDLVDTPAQLGPLQDNGGPTPTHAPLPGSPLLDAGDPAQCPAADQRGVARPIGVACDIGAVESAGSTPYLLALPAGLRFVADKGPGILPPAQSIKIQNAGGGALGWSATSSAPWLSIVPAAGSGAATAAVSVNPAGLANGAYDAAITVTAPRAGGSPVSIPVTFVVDIPPTYCAWGDITDPYGVKIPGAKVSAGAGREALTDGAGRYLLCNLPAGSQTLTATRADYTFTPASFTISGPPDAGDRDFQAKWVGPAGLPGSYLPVGQIASANLNHGPIGHLVQVWAIDHNGQKLALTKGSAVKLDANGALSLSVGPVWSRTQFLVFVEDVTAGSDLPVRATITFYQPGYYGPPQFPPAVPGITLQVQPTYPLDAAYLDDIGMDFTNKVTVKVNWNGRTPGQVEFQLNSFGWVETADAKGYASRTFTFPQALQPGGNVLRIRASSPTAGGERSAFSTFVLYRQSSPPWLTQSQAQGILTNGRKEGEGYNASVVWDFSYPLPVGPYTMGPFGIGGSTYLGTSLKGWLVAPLRCSTGAILANSNLEPPADLTFLGRRADNSLNLIDTYHERSTPRGKDCALLQPSGSFVKPAQWSATQLLAKKPWYVLLTDYNSGFATHPAVAGKRGTTQWTMIGDASATLRADLRPQSSWPYWALYDVSVTGDLSIKSPAVDTNAFVDDLSASATGKAEFNRSGLFNGNWGWDKLTLIGSAQATFVGFSELSVCPSPNPYALCIPGAQETRETLVKSIWWRYPASGWPLGAGAASADAETVGVTELSGAAAVPGAARAAASAAADASEVVAADVFTYAMPALAVEPVTGEALLLWSSLDAGKPALQNMELSFSRKPSGDGWSAPAALTNDSLIDGAPAAAWAGDGKGIAIWPRLEATLTPGAPMGAPEANQIELVTASFDPASGAWSAPVLLTSNSARDENARLARNAAGQVLAVWRQNDAGLTRGTAADPDHIMAAVYDAGWGAAAEVAAGIPGVVDLAAGFGQGAATVAFTRELAPTGIVTPTLQLFTAAWDGSTWSAPVQRTDDDLGHRRPQLFYNDLNQPLLLWLAGDGLRLHNLATDAIASLDLTGLGAVTALEAAQDAGGNIVAVLPAAGAQNDLHLARYDRASGMWSAARPLTGDLARESSSAPALDATGALLLGYARTEVSETTVTDTLPETGEVYTYAVPSLGQTDILALTHAIGPNLTLAEGDLVLSDAHPAAGATVLLTATVRNTGDAPVPSGSVAFYDGDPAAGGVLFATVPLSEPLPGGGSAVVTASQTADPGRPLSRLYAVADPDGILAETDESDNRASVAAFGPDLTLEVLDLAYFGYGQVQIESLVRNTGTAGSGVAQLRFYRDAVTGTPAVTSSVPLLAPGEVYTATSIWDSTGSTPGEALLIATVNWNEQDFPEAATEDNAAPVSAAILPNLLVSPFTMRTEPAVGGGLTITVTVANGGLVDTPQAELKVLLDDPFTGSTLFSMMVPPLAAGESAELSEVVNNLPALPVTFYAWVNQDAAFLETVTADNLVALVYGEGGWSPAAPMATGGLAASEENGFLRLDWNAVIQDIEGGDIAGVTYEVYRAANAPYFTAGTPYAEGISDAWFIDPEPAVLGNTGSNYFYLVRAVANGLPSADSDRVGTLSFSLVPGGP